MIDPEKRLSHEALFNILTLSKDATGIYTGEELYIQSANNALLRIWGKDSSVIGMTIEEAIPELEGQPFIDMLKNVWRTGETLTGKDVEARLEVDGELQTFYFDFEYRAIPGEDGKTYCILHTTTEVSERIRANKIIEENERSERALNEELSAANEELYSSNEELAAMNEEISSVNDELRIAYDHTRQLNKDLQASEHRFKTMVQTTPIGMAVFNGPHFIIQTANQTVLDIWGRTLDQVVDRRLLDVFPELQGQPFPGYLQSVMETGKAIGFPEIPVDVNQPDGTINSIYVDFSYDPITDIDGNVTSILVSVSDITPAVDARNKIQEQKEELEAVNEELLASNEEVRLGNEELQENRDQLLVAIEDLRKSEDNLRLTVEAANLGIFNLEIATNQLIVNSRFRELYNLPATGEVDTSQVISNIDPEFHDYAQSALQDAIENDLPCDMQYTVTDTLTKQKRWLRSVGRVFYNADRDSRWFYGVIQDITEQKKDEQRKNDFIGMVSHELKTPLTSLNAYLQMLEMRARDKGDEKTLTALVKSVKQIKKMTNMINGFLNVSRLESGKIHMDKQEFDIADLIFEAEDETIATVSSHNIIFAPVEKTIVYADKDKIGQVINNFISNAVKYSPPLSTINVACITENGFAVVSVKDQGMGIAKADQEKLFERYYRVEGTHMTTISGFGIGLYLCAEIIHRHDGKIWVDSDQGEGATFYFSIPLK
ncbi:ATP-binding protein [Mucilaginibacter ginkgonis]|uniref:histidine kinase n=1 Tax=Mucilaginibacter ginkgonis TaxID=2682091 RepID=A0A6I4I2N7_9SPHI|nr:ATP-binding protein [Mucilaginibacter ginkgonis]QQL49499.1 PAS domain-containing protein [Mucilaginibacter ginkgonis]